MRLKLIEYFKDELGSPGVSFLQETCSNNKFEQKWKEELKSQAFFCHGKTNYFGVLTAYFGKETFTKKTKKNRKLLRKVAF